MRFLVTGGAGFIGSHLCEALVARGDEVVALDDLSTGSVRNLDGVQGHSRLRLVRGSVLDEQVVNELVAGCQVVIHLAAAVGVRLVVDQPLRSLRTNIGGTQTVLEAVHRHDRHVLIASSSEVYGKGSGKLGEDSDRVLGPPSVLRWGYAVSKALDETLALAYRHEHGMPAIVCRFFNTSGPRQTGRYGMVIPRLVAQALMERDLTVYGDGSQTRCFCDVSDVVRAITSLVDDPRAGGKIFNVGSEEEVRIADLAERVIGATATTSRVRFVPYSEVYGGGYEDMLRRVPDTSRIRSLVGWEPEHDLDAIIKRVISYAQETGPATLLG